MKIAHFGDTHIRNLKYHDVYRQVFTDIYKVLQEEQPDYIIHCGDIAHTSTEHQKLTKSNIKFRPRMSIL